MGDAAFIRRIEKKRLIVSDSKAMMGKQMKMTTNNFERKKVFISYVKNNSDQIDRICEVFKKNNISYWLDRKDIEPGKLWKDAIKDAINNGAYFLACFSKEYEEKTKTYMNEEILIAIDILRQKPFNSGWFIPIKLSECQIPAIDIGGGKTLQDLYYLKLYEDWDAGVKRLVDMIKRVADPEQIRQQKIGSDYFQKEYFYRGLKSLIESGDGTGFHNADLGHPVYRLGATGKIYKEFEYADSPQKNLLFKMLSKLSKELKQLGPDIEGYIWWYDFSEWKDFCKFAVDIYDKRKKYWDR